MSFLTYHIKDYMLAENVEAYDFFLEVIEMLPNKEQYHFNNPEEKAYMDKLYNAIESFRDRQTLYRFRKLMVLFLGDKFTARMLTSHISKEELKKFFLSIDKSHPFGDLLHHIIDFIEHNEQFTDKAHRRQEMQPIRAVGHLTPEEEVAVASMPFRYNFWATNRAHAKTLENIFAKPDFFDRFALHSLGFSFAERDFGERNNYAGWYAPAFHYLNIVPSKGDVKITMFHEYVHAVDFGTKKIREDNTALAEQWDSLWNEAYGFLWDTRYSPFAKGYKEQPVRLNFTEDQMMNLVKDFAAQKERKDVFKADLPPWYTWLMMDKLRFRKDYYALKEEMIARLGSMLLFVEYGRIQNEAGRVLHLKEELHTSTGITEEKMQGFQEKAVEWCKKFETFIQSCNSIDLQAGDKVSYLNYMPVDLRPMIEALQPVELDTTPEIRARYENLFNVVKGLLQSNHQHITLSHYLQALKGHVSEKTLSLIAKSNVTRGKLASGKHILTGSDPLLYLVMNQKEGLALMDAAATKKYLSDTFHPHGAIFDTTIEITQALSAEEDVEDIPFLEKDNEGGVSFWSPNKNMLLEDLWIYDRYHNSLESLADIADTMKDPKAINDFMKKIHTIQRQVDLNIVNAVEACGKKLSRTGNLSAKDASFAEVFSLFESQPAPETVHPSVDKAMEEFFAQKEEYQYDYQIAMGNVKPLTDKQASTIVFHSAFYGMDFAKKTLQKYSEQRDFSAPEIFEGFAKGLVQSLDAFKEETVDFVKQLKSWKKAHQYKDVDDDDYDHEGLEALQKEATRLLSVFEKVSHHHIPCAVHLHSTPSITCDMHP